MKKIIVIASAIALVGAVAFVAVGDNAVACDKSGKTAEAGYTKASKSSCSRTAEAGYEKSSCSKTAEAGYEKSSCSKTAEAGYEKSKCSAAAAASAGCSGGRSAVAGYEKADASCSKICCSATAKASEQAKAVREVTDELPYGSNKRVVLTGSLECGHCTYEATATCAPLLKTTDGKVYPLSPNSNMVKSMKSSKSGTFEVSARVKKMYGTKYLDVVAFQAL